MYFIDVANLILMKHLPQFVYVSLRMVLANTLCYVTLVPECSILMAGGVSWKTYLLGL